MFITFEGIEGSGKSTLRAAIDAALRAQGHRTLLVREPGGTPASEAIRAIVLDPALPVSAMTEALLMNAARAELVAEVIRPALERGDVVLCDRYVHSSVAYQGYGRGLPLEVVRSVCEAATGGLMPDLTLLVDISCETSRRRLAERGTPRDRMELTDGGFHQRIREGYLKMARTDPRIVVIDGERSAPEVEDAALAALSAIVA
jgi:dTMP kinase